MRFDTVIRNGAVVTATDTFLADVGISGDKVTAIAAQLPAGPSSEQFQLRYSPQISQIFSLTHR